MNNDAELTKFVTMCVVTTGVLILVSLWNKLQIGILAPPKKFSLQLYAWRNLLAIQIIFKGLNNCFGRKFMTSKI